MIELFPMYERESVDLGGLFLQAVVGNENLNNFTLDIRFNSENFCRFL